MIELPVELSAEQQLALLVLAFVGFIGIARTGAALLRSGMCQTLRGVQTFEAGLFLFFAAICILVFLFILGLLLASPSFCQQ